VVLDARLAERYAAVQVLPDVIGLYEEEDNDAATEHPRL
jgi:hypothetical protein